MLGMEDCSYLVNDVMKAGFSLSINHKSKPHVFYRKLPHDSKFGFKSKKSIEETRLIE